MEESEREGHNMRYLLQTSPHPPLIRTFNSLLILMHDKACACEGCYTAVSYSYTLPQASSEQSDSSALLHTTSEGLATWTAPIDSVVPPGKYSVLDSGYPHSACQQSRVDSKMPGRSDNECPPLQSGSLHSGELAFTALGRGQPQASRPR